MGVNLIVILLCEWVDIIIGNGVKKYEHEFTLVNFSHQIHTSKQIKDEPYIFASQAKQASMDDVAKQGQANVVNEST